MMGVFVSLDFFLFYIFWELMLLPMYFLIGIWGGPRREYAAIKFFLYTLFGSIFILLVMIGLYFSSMETLADGSKVFTFNLAYNNGSKQLYAILEFYHRLIQTISDLLLTLHCLLDLQLRYQCFPFHTWLTRCTR